MKRHHPHPHGMIQISHCPGDDMTLKDLFTKRSQVPSNAPQPMEATAAMRSAGMVTLEDVKGFQALFQTWFKDDAGVGVTIDRALTAPPVFCAVMFLSRTMANLPIQGFKKTGKKIAPLKGKIPALFARTPNGEITAFDFKQYLWHGMWTHGAGRAWIERDQSGKPIALWPLEFRRTRPIRKGFKKVYEYRDHDRVKTYPAADVIDLTYAYEDDFITPISPIHKCRGAIGLYINLQTYANSFFKKGGVPPLTLEGPMASGSEAVKRSADDVEKSITHANENDSSILPIPVGFKLAPLAFDPSKGQMVEAKRAQIIEIAQAFQLGPSFLQDLSNGKFNNVEQQDLSLVKHLIAQFATKLEQELGLKMFGVEARGQYFKHNLNALLRGDFKSRIEGYARGINTGQITMNESRELEDRPKSDMPEADKLHVQGATVPIDTPRKIEQKTPNDADDGAGGSKTKEGDGDE